MVPINRLQPGGIVIPSEGIIGNLIGASFTFLVLSIIAFIILYIYVSLAYSKIGKKGKLSSPGIAWMPSFGPIAIIFESSKMHWWPFPILTIGVLISYILLFSVLIIGPIALLLSFILLFLLLIFFSIIGIIWHWKTYKNIGKPGWWILVPIIISTIGYVILFISGTSSILQIIGVSFEILGVISHLIFIGIAAWSKSSPSQLTTPN